jgi:hypothetical protein
MPHYYSSKEGTGADKVMGKIWSVRLVYSAPCSVWRRHADVRLNGSDKTVKKERVRC